MKYKSLLILILVFSFNLSLAKDNRKKESIKNKIKRATISTIVAASSFITIKKIWDKIDPRISEIVIPGDKFLCKALVKKPSRNRKIALISTVLSILTYKLLK